jgi:hypothetical protein
MNVEREMKKFMDKILTYGTKCFSIVDRFSKTGDLANPKINIFYKYIHERGAPLCRVIVPV